MSEKPSLMMREDGLGWVEGQTKVIGRPPAFDPAAALVWNSSVLKLSPHYGRWFPRGVYKFKTWEQEAEWTRTHQGKIR